MIIFLKLLSNKGFITIEFLTYFFIFSLIITLTFSIIIYFLDNTLWLINRPSLNNPIFNSFNKYLRFGQNLEVNTEYIYFEYKNDNYQIINENNNLTFYKNNIKEIEFDKYKIYDKYLSNNRINIVYKNKKENENYSYSITNINQ